MIRRLYDFLRLIFLHGDLIISMAKREVRLQYVGSLLGFVWVFIQPMVMIFVFWVVFSIGFRVQPKNDVPFVVWLTAGMSIWFVFAEIVNGSSGVISANAPLIKKTVFDSQILPVVKVVSCVIAHLVFLLLLILLIVFHGMPFSLYWFQSLYYLLCMVVFSLGLAWITSALNVFIRDVGQMVVVLLQVGFWATPIFWDIHMMPPKLQTILRLNPMFYVVQGYRESFIYFRPFWGHPYYTLYFWCVAVSVFVAGALIFRKLRPQFADVL